MTKYVRICSVILSIVAATAPAAYAQRDNKLALGASVGRRQPADGTATHGDVFRVRMGAVYSIF